MLYYIIDLINYYYNDYSQFCLNFIFVNWDNLSLLLYPSIQMHFFLELGHSFSEQTEKGLA